LVPTEPEELTLPWAGGKNVYTLDRSYTIKGRRPPEHGWYTFIVTGGRNVKIRDPEPAPIEPFFATKKEERHGYVVGDRFIQDGAHVDPDPKKLIAQTKQVFCVERGLDRFARATVFEDREGRLIFLRQEWPEGSEVDVLAAYQDRKDSVQDISGVTPALDLAFQWISWGREMAEEAAREAARQAELLRQQMEKEERIAQAMRDAGTGAGRRELAKHDFPTAARLALRMSNAEYLDSREGFDKGTMVVDYRYRNRRLQCVCNRLTLQIIDAGVCLDNHHGEKGDTYFTLESLPTVIGQAMDEHKLVVWRHVGDDPDPDYEYDEERW